MLKRIVKMEKRQGVLLIAEYMYDKVNMINLEK